MDKAGDETALRYLVSQQMDVYVIQVLSAEEIDPRHQRRFEIARLRRRRRGRDHGQCAAYCPL